MVWAKSFKIGCGYSTYRKRNFVKKYLVCNYGDAGNLLRTPIYNVGRPCSRCPANICSRKFPGLCPVPGETGFQPLNSSFVQMVDINPDVEVIRPSQNAANPNAFNPIFVDTNEIEEFDPPRPQNTNPVQQNLRPINSNIDPDLFVFSPRPLRPNFFGNQNQRPLSFLQRVFGNMFRG